MTFALLQGRSGKVPISCCFAADYNTTARHCKTSKSIQNGGNFWKILVFFQIASKGLSFADFLQLFSFVEFFCHFLRITNYK
jgi:hypothetical protein